MKILEPKCTTQNLSNDRLVAQEGCFVSCPLPNSGFEVSTLPELLSPGNIGKLYSVEISAVYKQKLRKELNNLGINHRTLFPGLDGIAKWVKLNPFW